MANFIFRRPLWQRIFIGLFLGAILGILMRFYLSDGATHAETFFKPIGDAFVRLIRMLIVPLISMTLIAGIVSMGSPDMLRRVGLRAFGLYFITTLIAITLGTMAGLIIQPGSGVELPSLDTSIQSDVQNRLDTAGAAAASLTDRLLAIIPTNPIQAMVSGDILAIIFFSILVGVAILIAGDKGRAFGGVVDSAATSFIALTEKIMELAPIGVFALMVWVTATQDFALIANFAKLTLTLYFVCGIQILVIYPIVLMIVARQSPIEFFRGMSGAMAIAYSTASSAATLPATIESLVKNLKVKRSNATGVAAIGSTLNMDGAAIYLSLICLFALQANGMNVTAETIGTIAILATLGSIGAAGIPNGGLFMSAALLGAIGFSSEEVLFLVAVLFPFDRVLDMMRTLTNVTGDATVATSVDRMLVRSDKTQTTGPEV